MANLMTLTFAHALNCIEFVPISLLAFVTILNVWMIWRSAILHINLKAILLVQSFLIFGYSCGRIFELIWLFTQNFQSNPSEFFFFINFMHATIAEANMIGHVMIVERIMAILFVRKYEEWKSPWFALGWMSIMILFAILTFVIPSFGASNKLGFAVIFTHVVLIFSIVELIAFAILNLYNRKRYEYFNNIRADLTHKYKLSERYQLNQNIYSGQQLGPSFFFHLVNIICSNVVCIMIVYLQLQSPSFDLYMAIIFIVHALSKLGIEITVITFHPVMRRKMLEIWKHFLRILNCRNASTVQQVNIIDRSPARELVALGQLRGTRTNCGRGKIEQKDQQNQQMKHFKILEHFWQ